jgi:uncharacterized YccA/Bax inhibitor family protein
MFDKSMHLEANMQGTMSVRGAINKFGFLLLMVIAGAAYSWNLFEQGKPDTMYITDDRRCDRWLITAIAITFKPNWAGISRLCMVCWKVFYRRNFCGVQCGICKKISGVVMQAVGLTFGVAIAMFMLYNFRIIKAQKNSNQSLSSAYIGYRYFLPALNGAAMFGVNMPFMYDSSALSIGISLFIVAIAALNLILDFDMIEQGAERGAPKFMEWYGAFGLLVTIVWLYIEILRLLSKVANNK